MTIQQIIDTVNNFTPFTDDDSENDNESFFYKPMQELKHNEDFELAFEPIFRLLEKYPTIDLGSPGPFVHTLESFPGCYEKYLYESLNRKPVPLTAWMFNRIINAEKNVIIRQSLVDRLQALITHPLVDENTLEDFQGFLSFQKGKNA